MPVPLFFHADILPLTFLYFKSVCCLMHDIRNRKVPSNISNLLSDTKGLFTWRWGVGEVTRLGGVTRLSI